MLVASVEFKSAFVYNWMPHALIIFQDRRVESSLLEVQPTQGMDKVHIRRKRQSMMMACKLTPPPLPPERAQKL